MNPIVDEAELDRQTFGDAELRREIIALFAQQTPMLAAALAASAGAARAEIAHRLKGSALALGAAALAAAAAGIEEQPQDEAQVQAALRLCDETVAALTRLAAA